KLREDDKKARLVDAWIATGPDAAVIRHRAGEVERRPEDEDEEAEILAAKLAKKGRVVNKGDIMVGSLEIEIEGQRH
ncbi:unnamed protein product, partial [marine sediment metagenome]